MKNICFLFVMCITCCAINGQTIITYGNNKVSVAEFERAYNKNKTPVTDKEKALREYIGLYTNFKLKVQAAHELRLDTSEQIKKEMADFRSQVEQNYMSDDKGREQLINEAVQRSFKELHIVHFSIKSAPGSSASDTLKASEAINRVYAELRKGNNNFESIVGNVSPAPVKFNDVGFVTAFSLPYQFENLIYNLQPGESTKPYRTTNAWHIFKLVEERKSTGIWKVAQILLSISPTASAHEKAEVKKVADSVHALLLNGAESGF